MTKKGVTGTQETTLSQGEQTGISVEEAEAREAAQAAEDTKIRGVYARQVRPRMIESGKGHEHTWSTLPMQVHGCVCGALKVE